MLFKEWVPLSFSLHRWNFDSNYRMILLFNAWSLSQNILADFRKSSKKVMVAWGYAQDQAPFVRQMLPEFCSLVAWDFRSETPPGDCRYFSDSKWPTSTGAAVVEARFEPGSVGVIFPSVTSVHKAFLMYFVPWVFKTELQTRIFQWFLTYCFLHSTICFWCCFCSLALEAPWEGPHLPCFLFCSLLEPALGTLGLFS